MLLPQSDDRLLFISLSYVSRQMALYALTLDLTFPGESSSANIHPRFVFDHSRLLDDLPISLLRSWLRWRNLLVWNWAVVLARSGPGQVPHWYSLLARLTVDQRTDTFRLDLCLHGVGLLTSLKYCSSWTPYNSDEFIGLVSFQDRSHAEFASKFFPDAVSEYDIHVCLISHLSFGVSKCPFTWVSGNDLSCQRLLQVLLGHPLLQFNLYFYYRFGFSCTHQGEDLLF